MRKGMWRILGTSGVLVAVMSGSAAADDASSGWQYGGFFSATKELGRGVSPGVIARQALRRGDNPASLASDMLAAGLPEATVRSAIVGAGGPSSAVHRTPLGGAPLAFGHGFDGGHLQDVLHFKLRLLKKILGTIFPGFPPSPH